MKKISPETWRNYKFAGEEDGKNCTIYYLSDSDGSGKGIMHVYEVMPSCSAGTPGMVSSFSPS